MPDLEFIKLKTYMFDDEKIRIIESMPDADSLLIIWVKLLCQAGKTYAGGYICLNESSNEALQKRYIGHKKQAIKDWIIDE